MGGMLIDKIELILKLNNNIGVKSLSDHRVLTGNRILYRYRLRNFLTRFLSPRRRRIGCYDRIGRRSCGRDGTPLQAARRCGLNHLIDHKGRSCLLGYRRHLGDILRLLHNFRFLFEYLVSFRKHLRLPDRRNLYIAQIYWKLLAVWNGRPGYLSCWANGV